MIRLNLILLLALGQAVFSERLALHLATGGRGVVGVPELLGPWVVFALVLLPCWGVLGRALGTRRFLLFWMPFHGLSILLPLLGVALGGFPPRSAYAAWAALTPLAFVLLGAAGGFQAPGAARLARSYFLFAVLAQAAMATVQTLGQLAWLPGILKPVYTWDFNVKVAYQSGNIILGRATGFYLNPNALGVWALLAWWTSCFLLKGTRRWVGCAAAGLTILLCQSRGTLAAFLVSGAGYGLVWMFRLAGRRQRLGGTLGLALGLLALLAVAMPGSADPAGNRLASVPVLGQALERYASGARVLSRGASADANFGERTRYWRAAITYLGGHPFGSLGSTQMVLGVPPDNQYVAALEQGSFLYFGALLLALCGGLRLVTSPRAPSRLLAVASLALMVNGVSAVPFAYPASLLFWLLVGLQAAEQVRRREWAPQEVDPP
jgi:hypothetical protein